MAQSTFSLSWDSHRNNICNGLSTLQQNEEFVDMTLAADGHHVKVHQLIIALASPYIKDLISTAACPHPVIFLNKISYRTLSALLEYIYTGEVLVSIDHLTELIEAARDLHIKGLEDMDIESSLRASLSNRMSMMNKSCEAGEESEGACFEVTSEGTSPARPPLHYTIIEEGIGEDSQSPGANLQVQEDEGMVMEEEEITGDLKDTLKIVRCTGTKLEQTEESSDANIPSTMQYTVSNQGSLQMILNRYMYYLKHSNRNNTRQWRCVDYLNNKKCPALVVTKDDVVVQRISAHMHPFHDKRILKKVFTNAVFTALQEAEHRGMAIKYIKSKENNDEKTKENDEKTGERGYTNL